jgi:cellobionic acid phosphorylase
MARSSAPVSPSSEFTTNGTRYVVRDVHLVYSGLTHLINNAMELKIDLRGQCSSRFLQPNNSVYAQNLRSFYLRDDESGKFWSVPFDPVQVEPDEYEFSAGVADVQWRVTISDIEARLRVVVPRNDPLELWTVTVTNRSRRPRKISLYPYFPVGLLTWITQIAKYDPQLQGIVIDQFPYYVKVADYYKLRQRKNWIFCTGDRAPASFECTQREFLGARGAHDPEGLHRPKLANGDAHMESTAIVMQYPLRLRAGASASLNLAFGPARDRKDVGRLSRKYLKPGGADRALEEVDRHLQTLRPLVRIETPDVQLNHFVNTWLPQQTHFCGGLMRLSGEPCVRNAFQDAMGVTFTNPARARHWYITVLGHQQRDGFLPHGAPLAEGVDRALINTIPHKDMNVWPPLALNYYLKETGDRSVLDEVVGFKDSSDRMSVYEHVCLGLDWQLGDRTDRRLCRIGEGDWDDPLNMAGVNEKGESVWLTEALAIALDEWAEVGDLVGDGERAEEYRREADVCRNVINELAWDGQWYARGTTDAGRWFGTRRDKEGKIFLNAQSWAMICKAAHTTQCIRQCINAVNKHLMTPCGPMTMSPAFTSMREDIGKITQKAPGTSENGSVYSHAATFYAYGLYRARQGDEGFRVLRMLLTGNGGNSLERSQQLPLFLPNFYRGTAAGRTAGQSSNAWGTGTAAWYYRTVVTELLGIRGAFDGLRIDPQLPTGWTGASAWRRFRDADFTITFRRSARHAQMKVILDGQPLTEALIPIQPAGTTHTVEVLLPRA